MSFLILVRHGQSTWNLKKNLLDGWMLILQKRKNEAKKAGSLIKNQNINIDYFYSSLQLRANNTLKIIQKVLNMTKILIRLGNSMRDIMEISLA